jgi:hypothetical protein
MQKLNKAVRHDDTPRLFLLTSAQALSLRIFAQAQSHVTSIHSVRQNLRAITARKSRKYAAWQQQKKREIEYLYPHPPAGGGLLRDRPLPLPPPPRCRH